MSRKTSGWVIGCGIALGVVILIVAALVGGGYFFVREIVDEVKELEASSEELTAAHGRMADFCPPPPGDLPAERIETFLDVRRATEPVRAELGNAFKSVSQQIRRAEEDQQEESVFDVLKIIGDGAGILPGMFKYFKVRNQALLDYGMGRGEYAYLYMIIYYSWLGYSPADGPPFQMTGGRHRGGGIDWQIDEGSEGKDSPSPAEVEARRRAQIIRVARDIALPILRNQMAALAELPENEARNLWRQQLAAEIRYLEEEPDRLPWAEGLPSLMRDALEPFRESLESSYDRQINALELMPFQENMHSE
ncbi:MAG: hypothetical protein JXQ27_04920 [Acidobacteria bacterium]|nr:hypothetical protein [Acidobacteriota bacterium]